MFRCTCTRCQRGRRHNGTRRAAFAAQDVRDAEAEGLTAINILMAGDYEDEPEPQYDDCSCCDPVLNPDIMDDGYVHVGSDARCPCVPCADAWGDLAA